jgi:hypothetical protein
VRHSLPLWWRDPAQTRGLGFHWREWAKETYFEKIWSKESLYLTYPWCQPNRGLENRRKENIVYSGQCSAPPNTWNPPKYGTFVWASLLLGVSLEVCRRHVPLLSTDTCGRNVPMRGRLSQDGRETSKPRDSIPCNEAHPSQITPLY